MSFSLSLFSLLLFVYFCIFVLLHLGPDIFGKFPCSEAFCAGEFCMGLIPWLSIQWPFPFCFLFNFALEERKNTAWRGAWTSCLLNLGSSILLSYLAGLLSSPTPFPLNITLSEALPHLCACLLLSVLSPGLCVHVFSHPFLPCSVSMYPVERCTFCAF